MEEQQTFLSRMLDLLEPGCVAKLTFRRLLRRFIALKLDISSAGQKDFLAQATWRLVQEKRWFNHEHSALAVVYLAYKFKHELSRIDQILLEHHYIHQYATRDELTCGAEDERLMMGALVITKGRLPPELIDRNIGYGIDIKAFLEGLARQEQADCEKKDAERRAVDLEALTVKAASVRGPEVRADESSLRLDHIVKKVSRECILGLVNQQKMPIGFLTQTLSKFAQFGIVRGFVKHDMPANIGSPDASARKESKPAPSKRKHGGTGKLASHEVNAGFPCVIMERQENADSSLTGQENLKVLREQYLQFLSREDGEIFRSFYPEFPEIRPNVLRPADDLSPLIADLFDFDELLWDTGLDYMHKDISNIGWLITEAGKRELVFSELSDFVGSSQLFRRHFLFPTFSGWIRAFLGNRRKLTMLHREPRVLQLIGLTHHQLIRIASFNVTAVLAVFQRALCNYNMHDYMLSLIDSLSTSLLDVPCEQEHVMKRVEVVFSLHKYVFMPCTLVHLLFERAIRLAMNTKKHRELRMLLCEKILWLAQRMTNMDIPEGTLLKERDVDIIVCIADFVRYMCTLNKGNHIATRISQRARDQFTSTTAPS